MFHLLLGLIVLVLVLGQPMLLGVLAQRKLKGKVTRWLPAGFGVLGLSVTSGWCLYHPWAFPPLWAVLNYWAVYGALLLITYQESKKRD